MTKENMNYLCIDTECTCLKLHPKQLNGNPFSRKNFLVYVGLLSDSGSYIDLPIEYGDDPYGDSLRTIQTAIDSHDCLVFFNAKFDLHWLSRYGINFDGKRIFDTQLVEFILSNQRKSYPSLNDTAITYGFEGKLDVVKEEYWKNGIDTESIPKEILTKYLRQDVEQTYEVFKHQREIIPDSKRRIISLANQDLLSLVEIEKNGMLFDVDTSKTEGNEIQEKINEIDSELRSSIGFNDFNPASGSHISAVLYGGSITIDYRESNGFFKTGARAGQEKFSWKTREFKFERLVEPLKGSELKKEGMYATNADTLRSLRAKGKAKAIITLLLERAEKEKLVGTYLHGLPKLIEEMDWEPNMIHGQLNQCIAVTGRLSSSKPNMQNFDKNINYLFKSRYQ